MVKCQSSSRGAAIDIAAKHPGLAAVLAKVLFRLYHSASSRSFLVYLSSCNCQPGSITRRLTYRINSRIFRDARTDTSQRVVKARLRSEILALSRIPDFRNMLPHARCKIFLRYIYIFKCSIYKQNLTYIKIAD